MWVISRVPRNSGQKSFNENVLFFTLWWSCYFELNAGLFFVLFNNNSSESENCMIVLGMIITY